MDCTTIKAHRKFACHRCTVQGTNTQQSTCDRARHSTCNVSYMMGRGALLMLGLLTLISSVLTAPDYSYQRFHISKKSKEVRRDPGVAQTFCHACVWRCTFSASVALLSWLCCLLVQLHRNTGRGEGSGLCKQGLRPSCFFFFFLLHAPEALT